MAPVTAKIFRNGRNQAIRIPVELSFDTDTVLIEKQGDALLVRPHHGGGWDRFFADSSLVLPPDFDTGEDPPPQAPRELKVSIMTAFEIEFGPCAAAVTRP